MKEIFETYTTDEELAMTGVAQLVGHHSTKGNVAGSIPGQDTGLGCSFGPPSRHVREATN